MLANSASPSPKKTRVVAQLGSAFDWGSKGRGFKSRQPDSRHARSARASRCLFRPLSRIRVVSGDQRGGASSGRERTRNDVGGLRYVKVTSKCRRRGRPSLRIHDAGCRGGPQAPGMDRGAEAREGELMCCQHHRGHRARDAGGTANSIAGAVAAIVVLIILLRACA